MTMSSTTRWNPVSPVKASAILRSWCSDIEDVPYGAQRNLYRPWGVMNVVSIWFSLSSRH